jgi:HJR/Mrr/RecB family endonuclease
VRCNNFNGLIKEICERYPNLDLPGYLADNLQLTLDKAEVLAARIEKQLLQKTSEGTKQNNLRVLEKALEEEPLNSCNYHVDCLSPKEFEYFIKWLLGELGYEAQPEMYAATEWGIDVVATKSGEKVVVQALRCPGTFRVTETAIRFTHEIRGDCPKALVITTAYFTERARAAAERAGIELWDSEALNQKIAEVREHINLEVQTNFPQYKGSLLHSLLALTETKTFLIESKAEGKYDLHLPGVKYSLLTFQAQNGIVTRCILRIKYNEPISEDQGEVIIGFDETNLPIGPPDEEAYGLVLQYLEQFLE